MVERRRISSGSPYEPVVGFSRVLVAGAQAFVSATAPTMPEGVHPPADTYGQTRRVLEIILAALAEVGAGPENVVRTRIYLTPTADFREAARAHCEIFSEIRPATGIIVVNGFVDPSWLVQMEAQAVLD